MLAQLRKVTRGFLAIVLIGLLGLAFAIWGINDMFRPIATNNVAQGRGVAVHANDFKREFDRELESIQQRNPGQPITQAQAVEANLHTRILDRMMSMAAVDHLAKKIGLGASDKMIAEWVRQGPAFKNPITGQFDSEIYAQRLAQDRMTTTMFHNDLRKDMVRNQLVQASIAGVRAPSSFAKIEDAFISERRVVSIAAITPDRIGAPPTPTPKDLEDFYKQNAARFTRPEFRAFTLVRAAPAQFEAGVTVDEAAVTRLMEQRAAAKVQTERRSFVQLSGAPDQAKAQDAARRLAAGEDANVVARALNMQAQVIENRAQSGISDPKVGAAVFGLKAAGDVTAPVQGLSWSVARLTGVSVAERVDQAALRAEARAEYVKEQAVLRMNEAIEKFEEDRGAGGDLAEIARKNGLEVVKSGLVTGQGLTERGEPSSAFLDNPALLQSAFQAAEGEPGDFQSDGEGYVLINVDQVRPSAPPPLEEVRPFVTQAWQAGKVGEAMKALSDQITKSVAEGASFADAVRGARLQMIASSQTLDRRTAAALPFPALGEAIFYGREGEVVSAPGSPQLNALLVARVEKIERPETGGDAQKLEATRQQIEQRVTNDTLGALVLGARDGARLRQNQALVDRIVGKEPAEGAAPQ
jgi:peptidyl-prolyl cis-trans isomerase D